MTPINWTPELDTSLRDLITSGCTLKETASKLGVTVSSVKRRMAKLRLKSCTYAVRYGVTWTEDLEQRLIQGRRQGKSLQQLSLELGMSRSAIGGKIARLGLVGKKNESTWTEEDIAQLRHLQSTDAPMSRYFAAFPHRTKAAIESKARALGFKLSIKRRTKKGLPLHKRPTPRLVVELEETTEGVAFLDCTYKQCRWIIGKQRCCGEPLSKRTSLLRLPYCDKHYDLSIDRGG